MQGLTFQGSLDDFWQSASPPDKTLFNAFRATLIELTQINGNFYNEDGMNMAVKNSLEHFKKHDYFNRILLADNESKNNISNGTSNIQTSGQTS
jgi:hypothetical protein